MSRWVSVLLASTVRTARMTDRTFMVSAILQAMHYRHRASLNLFLKLRLRESLQYMRVQNYRHSVYRPEVVLGILYVINFRLRRENNYLGNSGGADLNCLFPIPRRLS